MKISCVICAGTVRDDYFVAAPCGHAFHNTCLEQWLVHQKSCPQCRDRCLPRQVLRLYLDDVNSSQDASFSQLDNLSTHDLMERLQDQEQSNKQKDEALRIARQELEEIRQQVKAWQAQYDGAQFKIDKEKAINESLKCQLKLLQSEKDIAEEKAQEAESLKKKLVKLERIQLLLSGSKDEAHEIIAKSSSSNLSSIVIALKGEYDAIKERKMAIQREKDKYFQDNTDLRRKLRSVEMEFQAAKSDLSTAKLDLQCLENERDNLRTKVQLLEKALESPNSRNALQRILESPMPEVLAKRPKLDVGNDCSPLLKTASSEQQEINKPVHNRMDRSSAVLLPVQKLSAQNSFSITSGFNGFGGQSNFIVSKSRQNPPNKRPFKFAPRQTNNTLSSTKSKFPITKLKF